MQRILNIAAMIAAVVALVFVVIDTSSTQTEASYSAFKVVSKQEIDNMVVYQLQHKKTGCYWTLSKYPGSGGLQLKQMMVANENKTGSIPYCTKQKYGND